MGEVFQIKYLIIFAICLAYFCYSMGYNIQGPTWLDLQYLLREGQDRMSYGRSAVTIGYCLGCVMNGFLFEMWDRQHLMIYNLALMGISVLLTPLIPNYIVFLGLSALYGLSGSGTDIACNVWAMEIGHIAFAGWSTGGGSADTGPMMQLLHLFYALGSTFSSVISEPFLMIESAHNGSKAAEELNITDIEGLNMSATLQTGLIPVVKNNGHVVVESETEIHVAYTIAAIITFSAAALQCGLYIFRNKWRHSLEVVVETKDCTINKVGGDMSKEVMVRTISADGSSVQSTSDSESGLVSGTSEGLSAALAVPLRRVKQSKVMKIWTITMGAIIIGFWCGIEVISFQYFLTFLYHKGVPKGIAATMNTVFNANYAIGKLLGIFIAMRVPILWMLIGHMTLAVASYVTLLLSAGTSLTGAWIGTVAIGLGYSTNYPGIYSYVGQKVQMTNTIGSILMITGGVASTVGPIIVGGSIETDPNIFIYINALFAAIVFLAIGILEMSLIIGFPSCTPQEEVKNTSPLIARKGCLAETKEKPGYQSTENIKEVLH